MENQKSISNHELLKDSFQKGLDIPLKLAKGTIDWGRKNIKTIMLTGTLLVGVNLMAQENNENNIYASAGNETITELVNENSQPSIEDQLNEFMKIDYVMTEGDSLALNDEEKTKFNDFRDEKAKELKKKDYEIKEIIDKYKYNFISVKYILNNGEHLHENLNTLSEDDQIQYLKLEEAMLKKLFLAEKIKNEKVFLKNKDQMVFNENIENMQNSIIKGFVKLGDVLMQSNNLAQTNIN